MAKKKDTQMENKKYKEDKKKPGKILKIGTWNIRSLNGKEHELIEEFEKAKLDIIAVTETKKKEQGMIELERGHLLLYTVE